MRRILLLAVVLAAASPALAQTGGPDTEGGRYILRQTDDGYLRVDRESGDTSLCQGDGDSWTCRAVADDRQALEAEIARLADENADLARRVDELQQELAAVTDGDPADGEAPGDQGSAEPPAGEEENTLDLPSEKELDQLMETFESMMRRFLGMVRSLKDDMERDPI